MHDRLEIRQRGRVAEDDIGQVGGIRRSEPLLDPAPRDAVVGAHLAGEGIGVDRRHTQVAQHPGHRALAAADVAGQPDHLHGRPSTGGGWQCGQKCVLRWPTTMREIGRPQRRQGSPVRR